MYMVCTRYGGILTVVFTACCAYRPKPTRPLPNPVYEYEYMGSGPGGVAPDKMKQNPSYVPAMEVTTSFTSVTEGREKDDHMYDVLPFEEYEEGKEDTKHVGQGDAAVGGQEHTAK